MKRVLAILGFLTVAACSMARPAQVIIVTNYIYGVVTNYVSTTNYVSWTNTINTYTYVTTTNWITNTVVMPQVLTNLHVFGTLTVEGSGPGLVQTLSGTNVTGHLP
jgi:hypothetical protein